jgi:Transglutaminase-like superfamily
MIRSLGWLLAFSGAAFANAPEPENRLQNADFETGGKQSVSDWQTIYPTAIANPAPTFGVTTMSPHGGERAGLIRVDYEGGYSSFTQNIALDKKARSIHFEVYGRIEEPRNGAASIMIFFTVPGHKDGGEMVQSKRLTNEKEWTKLTIDAAVPVGATEATVRCGVFGPCVAAFDDAVFLATEKESVGVKLAVAHGDYKVTAKGGAKSLAKVSIPFPLGGQTPLAIRVTCEPAGVVADIAIDKDRENRPAKLRFSGLKGGDSATFRIETLALIRDREVSTGEGVALTAKPKIPKDVKPHLEKAPGLDIDAPAIKKLAGGVAKKDFGSVMNGVAKLLDEKLEYEGGENQGAIECLESGKAVCTGYANVGASLLIASGVPSRVLACVTLGSRLQEHYIIEGWTEKLGWCRMESTAAQFPWKDSENLVLRIVYPDAARSPFDVPLYKEGSNDLDLSFRMGDDTCWQGGDTLETFALDHAAVAAIEKAARARFEQLVKTPAPGASVVLLDDANLPDGARELAVKAREWAAKE